MSSNGIVPDGFDLHAARKAKSTTPDAERKRCPECWSVRINLRTDEHTKYQYDYHCNSCGAEFNEPGQSSGGPEGETA